jgi:hypothetical protein
MVKEKLEKIIIFAEKVVFAKKYHLQAWYISIIDSLRCELWGFIREINSGISHVTCEISVFSRRNYFYPTINVN